MDGLLSVIGAHLQDEKGTITLTGAGRTALLELLTNYKGVERVLEIGIQQASPEYEHTRGYIQGLSFALSLLTQGVNNAQE